MAFRMRLFAGRGKGSVKGKMAKRRGHLMQPGWEGEEKLLPPIQSEESWEKVDRLVPVPFTPSRFFLERGSAERGNEGRRLGADPVGVGKTLQHRAPGQAGEQDSRSESPGEVKPSTLARLSRPGPFEEEPRTGSRTAVGGQRLRITRAKGARMEVTGHRVRATEKR